MNLLIVLWIISLVPLFLFSYGIALFYQRTFKRKTYPYLFLIAFILYIASSISYLYPALPGKNLFSAAGGVLLSGASLRLHRLMTTRWK